MDYMLKMEGVEKRYDGFSLHDIGLSVEAGTIVGLIGPNGAGKTTTLKILLGLAGRDGGTIELLGAPVDAKSSLPTSVKSRIGVVLDSCAFPDSCTVTGIGEIGRAAYTTWDAPCFARLCNEFNLAAKKKVQELSRGMGMKLSLAFALAHHPQLLVLDEATSGLDPLAREEVLSLLRDFMADGDHGILMSTHITSDLEKIADVIACIDNGQLVFTVSKDAIADEAAIARCSTDDLHAIQKARFFEPNGTRLIRRGYQIDVLVPDKAAFARAFPAIALDRATIEDYMTLRLKGESL